MHPMKAAAEWFHDRVFTEEAIRPRAVRHDKSVPSLILAARSLENGPYQNWQSRENIFMKQGKLLASYEDDFDYPDQLQRYYPTYQSLTDRELRGYFSWRTRLRRGENPSGPLSFAFLYIYELINQIGTADPMDGYQKLVQLRDTYGALNRNILPYLKRWLTDYVMYYGLDPALLTYSDRERMIAVLEHVREERPERVMEAVKSLSRQYLERSKFYRTNGEDMDAVIVPVLRRMWDHYAARCKKTMTEQYFGVRGWSLTNLFDTAVFCDPLKRLDYEYLVDGTCVCRCRNGIWSVWTRTRPSGSKNLLGALLKTIDSTMRQEFGFGSPVKAELSTKWVLRIIQEEVQRLAAQKKTAEEKKIAVDPARLAQIRRDAAITREKLIVEEETDLVEEPAALLTEPDPPAPAAELEPDSPLSPEEYRLLQCLLYDRNLAWIQTSGCLLSVLVDDVNEKLYDLFQDCVLDDTPQLVEDYIDDLKEMVRP